MGALLALVLAPALAPVVVVASAAEVVLAPTHAHPGQTVTATGTGFDDCLGSNSNSIAPFVRLVWEDGRPLATAPLGTAGDRGGFRVTFRVPADARPEPYNVTASCYRSGIAESGAAPDASETAVLQVLAGSETSTRHSSSPGSSPSSSPTAASRPAGGTGSAGSTAAPSGSGSATGKAPPGAFVALGVVVLLLVGLIWLLTRTVRRLARQRQGRAARSSAARSSRVPTIEAIGHPGPVPDITVRRIGPGRSYAIRVVPYGDPGVQVVRRTDGVRHR